MVLVSDACIRDVVFWNDRVLSSDGAVQQRWDPLQRGQRAEGRGQRRPGRAKQGSVGQGKAKQSKAKRVREREREGNV